MKLKRKIRYKTMICIRCFREFKGFKETTFLCHSCRAKRKKYLVQIHKLKLCQSNYVPSVEHSIKVETLGVKNVF